MASTNHQRRTEKAIADALAGVLGSLVSLIAFYPLDVIKTNRQATIKSSASTSGRRHGSFLSSSCSSMTSFSTFRKTYLRGLSSKTLHTIASSFLFFYFDSFLVSAWMNKKKSSGKNKTPNAGTPKMSTLSRLILSAIAAMMNTCLTLPLDVLSAQQQTKSTRSKDDSEELENDDNHHELYNNYKNRNDNDDEEEEVFFVEANMDASSSCSSDEIEGNNNEFSIDEKKDNDNGEEKAENRTGTKIALSTSSSSLSVSLPRTISRIIETPLFISAATTEKKNVLSLWKGLWPSLLLCSNPSIHYTVFDMLKARILQQKEQSRNNGNTAAVVSLSSREAFLAGLIAKAVATIATYPLIRAKVIMIVSASSSIKTPKKKSGDFSNNNDCRKNDNQDGNCDLGMIQTLQEIYHQHGLSGLYRGCDLQLFHTVLKSALMMMVRERINATTRRMVLTRHSPTPK